MLGVFVRCYIRGVGFSPEGGSVMSSGTCGAEQFRRGGERGSISLAEALLSACHLLKVDMVIEEAEEISTVPRPVQNTD